jgi:flagellar biosynthesis GTPase FlhF
VEIAQALWSNLSKEFTNVGKTKDDMNMLLEIMRRTGAVTGPLVIKNHSAAWIVNTQLLQDKMANVNKTMRQDAAEEKKKKKKQKEEKEKKEQAAAAAATATAEEKKKEKEKKEQAAAAAATAEERKKQKEEKEKKKQAAAAAATAAATAEEKKKEKEKKEQAAAAATAEAQSVVVAEAGPQLNRRPQGGAAGSPKRAKLVITNTSSGAPGLNGRIVLLFSSSSLRGVEAKIISTKDDTAKKVLRYVYHTIHIPCACPPCTLRL